MENHELINRYIYATTKNLPRKTRTDVAKELQSLICDILEERCGEVLPTDKDVRVVLTELGTPTELARKYSPNGDKVLIGAAYYGQYLFVLKIVLNCILLGTSIAAITAGIGEGLAWYWIVAKWATSTVTALIGGFGMVSLIFALFEYKGIVVKPTGDFLDTLPPVPAQKNAISKGDAIGSIVMCVLFVFIFLLFPNFFSAPLTDGNGVTSYVPIFNEQALGDSWFIIVALGALGISLESFKLIEGRYTKRLFAVTAVVNGNSAVLVLVWLSVVQSFINPAFLAKLPQLNRNQIVIGLLMNFELFLVGIILFALALDTILCAVKTYRAKD